MIAGAGTVDLAAANNPYTGGTTIDSGVLELANAVDAGSGGIAFTSSASAEIRLDAGANLANTISGFRGSDEIDFSQVGYATGDHAVANANGNVAIETTSGQTVATFNVTGPYQSANFKVAADASGHILVAYVNVTSYPQRFERSRPQQRHRGDRFRLATRRRKRHELRHHARGRRGPHGKRRHFCDQPHRQRHADNQRPEWPEGDPRRGRRLPRPFCLLWHHDD